MESESERQRARRSGARRVHAGAMLLAIAALHAPRAGGDAAAQRAPGPASRARPAWVYHNGIVYRQTAAEDPVTAVRLPPDGAAAGGGAGGAGGPGSAAGGAGVETDSGVASVEECLHASSRIRLVVDEVCASRGAASSITPCRVPDAPPDPVVAAGARRARGACRPDGCGD